VTALNNEAEDWVWAKIGAIISMISINLEVMLQT
jgi:hypothetical protein